MIPVIPTLLPRDVVFGGFTTRCGGVSKAPFDSLNLGSRTSDDSRDVSRNHEIFRDFLCVAKSDIAFMDQVHGDTVRFVDRGGVSPGTDGIVTVTPGIVLCVLTADCIPLLLFDPVTGASAAVHCGWRPLVSGIAERAIALMIADAGTSPETILAAAGPAAGSCCYEIGDDVARFLHHDSVVHRNGRLFGDLKAELKRRLTAAGVLDEHIEIVTDCTVCDESRYYSHRRDGDRSGRMAGFILTKKAEN